MSDFQLTRQLGLELIEIITTKEVYVRAVDIEKVLQESMVVHGFPPHAGHPAAFYNEEPRFSHALKARIILLEDFTPQKCEPNKHSPGREYFINGNQTTVCNKCGVKLKEVVTYEEGEP